MTVLDFRLEAEVSRVRFLRADIRDQLGRLGIAESDVDRLVLVVDEIVSNSIEHGQVYRGAEDVLRVRLTVEADRVEVSFHDPAVPPDTVRDILRLLERCRSGVPPLDSERGRGLFLIDDGLEALSVVGDESGLGLYLSGRLVRETA